jgi:hypothetical protein
MSANFIVVRCASCKTEKYQGEPCPRCTAGSLAAVETRLECEIGRRMWLEEKLRVVTGTS